jgi:putative hydrolase of the HAD superfamily
MVKKLSGVTFDFDATFYNYPRMVMGLLHRFGPHVKLIRDLTDERAKLRRLGRIENFRAVQTEAMAKRWGKPVDWTEAKLERVVYSGWNSAFDKVKPCAGVFEALDMCVANGLPMAVVSDYPPRDKMEKMGFMRYPWVLVLNCEDIGLLKPDPAGLRMALERMGTKPSETLHLGDSLKYDVQGAKNAGMMSAWFKWWWKRPKPSIQPDFTVKSFEGYMDLLEKEFGLSRP